MKIKFLPTGVEVEGNPDKSLLQIAGENQIEIRSICKGVPSCAECRVKVVEGDQNLVPPNKAELALIGTSYYLDSRRLSCQMRCYGDVTVDISEHMDPNTQNKKIRGFKIDKAQESKAVLDTMILTDVKTDSGPSAEASGASEQPKKNGPQDRQQDRHHKNRGGKRT